MAKLRIVCFAVVLALLSVSEPSLAANNVTTFPKPAVRDAWADIAGATDLVDPGNAFASAGWLNSSVPPARQFFNWVLNYDSNAVRYFSQRGIVDYDPLETYRIGAVVQNGNVIYRSLTNNNIGNSPVAGSANWGGIAVGGSGSTFVGPVTIASPTSGTALTVNAGTGTVSGILSVGGINAVAIQGDVALFNVRNTANTNVSQWGTVKGWTGAGSVTDTALGALGALNFYAGNAIAPNMSISNAGNVVVAAPTSGTAFTVNTASNLDSFIVNTTSATGSFGYDYQVNGVTVGLLGSASRVLTGSANDFAISAGASGGALLFGSSSQVTRFTLSGAGGLFAAGVTGGDQGAGTINAVALFTQGTNVLTSIANAQAAAQSAAIATSEAFTSASVAGLAPLVNPGFTGGTTQTQAPGTNTTQLATTAFVQNAVNAGSLVQNPGYQKFPSGIIFEWGQNGCQSASPGTTVSFPLAFPHSVFSVTGTAFGQNSNTITVLSQSVSSFSCINAVSGASVNWIAVGF
jgi:hypothetical protein